PEDGSSPAASADNISPDETCLGTFYLVPANADNRVVEYGANDKYAHLWIRDASHTQQFKVYQNGDYVCFKEVTSGKAITMMNGTIWSTRIVLEDYTGSAAQLWKLETVSGDYCHIVSKLNEDYVLDVKGGQTEKGTEVKCLLRNATDTDNQLFRLLNCNDAVNVATPFDYGASEEFLIVPCCAGASCVDYRISDSGIIVFHQTRTDNQRWKLVPNGDYYMIQSVRDGKVIQIDGRIMGNGASVYAGVPNGSGGNNQLWELDPQGDGSYMFRSKINRNYVLDLSSRNNADRTNFQLYQYRAANSQLFRFVPLSTPEREEDWGATLQDCSGSDWSYWDGSADTSWYTRDPDAETFHIYTAEELAGLAKLVRSGTTFYTKKIQLMRDINLCGTEWASIGDPVHAFCGSFNGNGHTITGLAMTQTGKNDQGFFSTVDAGTICDLAIKGSVSGDNRTGGLVGTVRKGHIVNVYSEVSITSAKDDHAGGLIGLLEYGGYVEHCTQNARVNSGDKDPFRGGIAGENKGCIRWCVNRQTVDCNWNYVGGIAGKTDGGKIEYCANYGEVCGGNDSQWLGGMTGYTCNGAIVFGCVNYGYIHSGNDDYIGGIVGDNDANQVWSCINHGDVSGDDHVGGIVGDNNCLNCLNTGHVWGDDYVGAISGETSGSLEYCRALSYSCDILNGRKWSDTNGAAWVNAEDLRSGKVCWQLNREGKKTTYGMPMEHVFYQNVGSDPYPTFAGSKVIGSDGGNSSYAVSVIAQKDYGTVEGAGEYKAGDVVTLTATPADGCVFDHYEVMASKIGQKTMYEGKHDAVTTEVETFSNETLELTQNLDRCYTVKAVFKPYDDTPEDLKQSVRVKLTVTNAVSGWNSEKIPVYLEDSAGDRHLWEIARTSLDGDGESAECTFDIGAASPVAVYAYPDFGGGLTVRDYSMKAQLWINGSGSPMESQEVKIWSYPFLSSRYHDDYMQFTFGNCGNSSIGTLGDDNTFAVQGTYQSCTDAWDAVTKRGGNTVIRLDSAWLLDRMLVLSGVEVTIDLNGHPMIRCIKKTTSDGGLIKLTNGASLHIIDSDPTSPSSAFSGGSLQGGRNADAGGLIYVESGCTLTMQNGTLYNGGTDDAGGGAIYNKGTVKLENVLIANCWAYGGRTTNNCGGAIRTEENAETMLRDCNIRSCYAQDQAGALMIKGGKVTLYNVNITGCSAKENEGGGIYMEYTAGSLVFRNGSVKGCSSDESDGGGMCLKNGTAAIENVVFEDNYAEDNGGAIETQIIEGFEINDCMFTANSADNNGGAIYYTNRSYGKQCGITNAVFTDNHSLENGGGIYVDASHLCLSNVEMTGNSAGSKYHGGGIYYNNGDFTVGRTMGMQGKMIVRNNKAGSNADNLFVKYNALYQDAKITNGGMYEGSEVHLTPDSSSAYTVFDEISAAQQTYLKVDKGFSSMINEKQKGERFVSSVIGTGNIAIIITGIVVLMIAIAVLLFVQIRKARQASVEPKTPEEPASDKKEMHAPVPAETAANEKAHPSKPSRKKGKKKKKAGMHVQ
ncbi:MAG: RICIN domain-containing protein, partial [Oscillospiraceae bacterium]|nr:RICIN domain-containing protein [Oscillospiraceae bacterium]